RFALRSHPAKNGKEFLDLLRRQHGRRLVENEQICVTIKSLEQLDTLLLSDREILDERARVDLEFQFVRKRLDTAIGLFEIDVQRRTGLGTENDILSNRHRVDQHKMLMHHANAERDRIRRTVDINFLVINKYLAAV